MLTWRTIAMSWTCCCNPHKTIKCREIWRQKHYPEQENKTSQVHRKTISFSGHRSEMVSEWNRSPSFRFQKKSKWRAKQTIKQKDETRKKIMIWKQTFRIANDAKDTARKQLMERAEEEEEKFNKIKSWDDQTINVQGKWIKFSCSRDRFTKQTNGLAEPGE